LLAVLVLALVSNYSELTQSVGFDYSISQSRFTKIVSNYSELTQSVGSKTFPTTALLVPQTVSNYSELTQSVGQRIHNCPPDYTIPDRFQLFRINPIGGAATRRRPCRISCCFQLFRINPIGGVTDNISVWTRDKLAFPIIPN